MYMLAKLTPSEDVTGGPWFTDGELDTEFIERLSSLIEMYVRSRSMRRFPRHAHAHTSTTSSHSKATTKDKGSMPNGTPKKPTKHQVIELEEVPPSDETGTGAGTGTSTATKRPAPSSFSKPPAAKKPTTTKSQPSILKLEEAHAHYLPHPPSFQDYPTLPDIMSWLNGTRVTDTPLSEEHVRQLLDLLYYDNRIERVTIDLPPPINNGLIPDEYGYNERDDPDYDPKMPDTVHDDDAENVFQPILKETPPPREAMPLMFRAVRILPLDSDQMYPGDGNAYTEVPCGRCPVFNLCEQGGPINASSCVYFQEWLEK